MKDQSSIFLYVHEKVPIETCMTGSNYRHLENRGESPRVGIRSLASQKVIATVSPL
jgi:hypothetical protein